MLISIHNQHGTLLVYTYLKQNLITINLPNQQFWDVFLIKRTAVYTWFYWIQTKSRHGLNMNIN